MVAIWASEILRPAGYGVVSRALATVSPVAVVVAAIRLGMTA